MSSTARRSLAPGGAGDDAAAQAKLAGGQHERLARAFLEDQLMDDWAGLQQLFGLDEEQLMRLCTRLVQMGLAHARDP